MANPDPSECFPPSYWVPSAEATAQREMSWSLLQQEWCPGWLPRALEIVLGFAVGTSSYYSDSGPSTMMFVLVSILVNELSIALVKMRRSGGGGGGGAPGSDRVYRMYERWSVLFRYFSITAVTYAGNEAFKRIFGDMDGIGILFMLVVIFIINEAIEALTSLPPHPPARRRRCCAEERERGAVLSAACRALAAELADPDGGGWARMAPEERKAAIQMLRVLCVALEGFCRRSDDGRDGSCNR